MNFIEKFLNFISTRGNTPNSFGLYHLICVVFVVVITFLFCKFFRKKGDRTVRKLLLICWIIMFIFELYKQAAFAFEYNNGDPYMDIKWYIFPFQLCSTPLYVLPLIVFLKDSKVRDALIAFNSTFALFGGLVVFVYPNDVFTSIIGINIQTMVHHGIQILTGIFLLVRYKDKLNLNYLLKGSVVFAITFVIAMILNEVVYATVISKGTDISFNMFYISRHFECHLPILNVIYTNVPYIVFLLVYFLGFVFIAFLILQITNLIIKLIGRKKYVTE